MSIKIENFSTDVYKSDVSYLKQDSCVFCKSKNLNRVDNSHLGYMLYGCDKCETDFYIYEEGYEGSDYLCTACGDTFLHIDKIGFNKIIPCRNCNKSHTLKL